MALDINAFIGKWPYWPIPASSAGDVAGKLSAWGIASACICSTRSVFVNWEDGNHEALAAKRETGPRLIAFACLGTFELSHRAADRKHDLRDYRARGFAGIRLYPQHHSYHLLYEDFVDDICEQAASLKFPVLLSLRTIMNWGVPSLDVCEMTAIVERHPQVPWILSGINYLHEIRASAQLLRRNPSVHLETSCVMGYRAVQKLTEECGHEQILFGSGSPVQHGRANLEKIVKAGISDAAREAILFRNAERLLEL
jgi:hypothetical protein